MKISISLKIFLIIVSILFVNQLNLNLVKAQTPQIGNYIDLPIRPNSNFYLTATPKNHSQDGNRSAVDFQIVDRLGFIDKGAPLYSPINGHAEYLESPNGSGVIEITSHDKQWKIVIAHVVNDIKTAQELNSSYPKYIIKDELVAYQGDSGYKTDGSKFAPHVHYELFKKIDGEFQNNNQVIDICSKINLKKHCDWIDNSGYVIYIHDK